MSRGETIWKWFKRVTTYAGGWGILFYETVIDKGERLWLVAASLGLIGIPIAQWIENLSSGSKWIQDLLERVLSDQAKGLDNEKPEDPTQDDSK